MLNLKQILIAQLERAERIAVLGIGSDLRADDAAGMLIAAEIEKCLSRLKGKIPLAVFFGGTVPENLTGEIKKFTPSHLIILDAAEAGRKAGEVFSLETTAKESNVSFSTHRFPAKVLIDYLVSSCGCRVIMLGIEPKTLEFGKPPSKEIRQAVKKASAVIMDVLQDCL